VSAAERTLLAVAYFFPPLGGGGVQRTVKFLKYLRPLGWRSEVVTVEARSYWVLDDTLAAEIPADTIVHRTGSLTGLDLLPGGKRGVPGADPDRSSSPPPPAVRSTARFRLLRWLSSAALVPDAYLGWFPFALAAARARIAAGGIDVLLTTSSPDTAHLVGLVLRERMPVPWVADFRDPWVRRLTFVAPTRAHLWLQTWLEGRVLARADRVLVTNDATRDDFLRRHPGIPAVKVAVVPNGYDPADLAFLRALPAPAPDPERRFVLAHTGLLSGRRTLAPLVAGLRVLLERRPDLRDRLRVRQIGPRESINEALVADSGLTDLIEFAPPCRHREILGEMAAADALLLIEADAPQGSLITPGKIFEYLAIGRPILALVPPGPAADLVRDFRAGRVIAPHDAAGIATALEGWLTRRPEGRVSQPEELLPYARPALARRLAELLHDLVNARATADLEPAGPELRRHPERASHRETG
jgi:glycosyltransferase involved in cell wall biosynthesis